MPRTNFESIPVNPIYKLFAGKIPLLGATSGYQFTKGGIVQNAMHELKYRGNQEVGEEMGKLLGLVIKEHEPFNQVDGLIPVPLHKKKLRKRGYNQCDSICRGLSETMEVPVIGDVLVRAEFSESQTRKGRYDRFLNVDSKFAIQNESLITNKTLLLVDDVVTTGSTLEACANTLLLVNGTEVCIATIACA